MYTTKNQPQSKSESYRQLPRYLGRDSIHFKNVTKIIMKNIMKNVMKKLSKSYNKKFKKSVVDTYLLFKLDFRDDFHDNFRDIFKCIESRPCFTGRRLTIGAVNSFNSTLVTKLWGFGSKIQSNSLFPILLFTSGIRGPFFASTTRCSKRGGNHQSSVPEWVREKGRKICTVPGIHPRTQRMITIVLTPS